jgi:hypothetical protein
MIAINISQNIEIHIKLFTFQRRNFIQFKLNIFQFINENKKNLIIV